MRNIFPVFIALLVILSAVAVAPVSGTSHPLNNSDDEVFLASSGNNYDVHGWERAVFPLRVSATDAAVEVQNPSVDVESGGDVNALGKDHMLVFDPGTQIDITFRAGTAANSAKLDGENIQVVAARVTGSDEGIPNTVSDALDLISQENVNENATYEWVNDGASLDSDGATDLTYTPNQPGHYVFFAVTSDGNDAVSITNNEISISSNITVVGTDAASVQRSGSSPVDSVTSTPDPGENIDFDVSTSNTLSSTGVTHVVAVFKQDTYRNSDHTIKIEEDELDQNFDLQNNSTFETSIKEVEGVADVDDGASVNGVELDDGKVSRAVGTVGMIDFIAEDLTTSAPDVDRSGATTVLNASLRADVDTSGDKQLTIETNSDWETGTYRYVYVGTLENDKSAITAATGTVEVGGSDGDDGDDGDGGGGGGGSSGTRDVVPPEEIPEEVQEEIDTIGGQPTNIETKTVSVDPGSGTATATFETSENVESTVLTSGDGSTEVTVTDLDPDTVTDNPAPGQSVSLSDITVSESDGDASDTEATVRFRVSNERLEERGTTAENLRAFRLVDGNWQGLETSVAEETANGVVLEAQTPGFSVFAVSAVEPPEASLSLDPATAQVGEEVTLSGVDSSDEDGEIVSYEWSVNGQTFSGETVTTSFDEPGDYTVELTVTDDSGETDTITETLTITQAETATPTTEPGPATTEPEPEPETPTTSDPLIPGFGFTTAILALLAAALIAIRRNSV
jgi:PGF-pre-PGF domain-containing protein/PGF-CTERM protein